MHIYETYFNHAPPMQQDEIWKAKVAAYGGYMAAGWKWKTGDKIPSGSKVTVSPALSGINIYVDGVLQGWCGKETAMIYALDYLIVTRQNRSENEE
jgi:hypothetical protein